MKHKKINSLITPTSWNDINCGMYYRQTLEQGLQYWWPKLFGFYLLKIGSLSIELDTKTCAISHQVNVGFNCKNLQVIANPDALPFANKSTDACLLAHTLSYHSNPHRQLSEVDRVLINDGWLILTTFNLISILGMINVCPFLVRNHQFRSRMFTKMRLLNWLSELNFEVVHYMSLKTLFSQYKNILHTNYSNIGCLNIIIARKRTIPLNFTLIKHPFQVTLKPYLFHNN
ncbi:methyltransferase domain-containing protein [Candidatus Palibaumannia cicadellinicola]|nr:methyltransferase domain-containing protein [Candidatus Baumannia cicadellinicola]